MDCSPFQQPRCLGDLSFRYGALAPHPVAKPVTPVITTSLYFIVFGAAIGSRMPRSTGLPMAPISFLADMLSLFMQSIFNASSHFLPEIPGTIYELLSAPISPIATVIGYVGAAATNRSSSAW